MLESAFLFLAFAALGIAGMAPTVTFGDCGELSAGAAALGLPHSPGYPLYVLAARAAASAIPFGDWGYRTNVFSALCAAAAAALLGAVLRRLGVGRAARLCAAAMLASSPLWRYHAGVTEVFALNSLALAALFRLCAGGAAELWKPRVMAAVGLCAGLGLANHQTMALAALPIAWLAWSRRPSGAAAARGLGFALAFLGAGLCCYAFLPLRSAGGPPLDWGHPASWDGFWRVLLRKDYGSLSLTSEGADAGGRLAGAPRQLWRWLLLAGSQLGPWTALALAGAAVWPSLGLSLPASFPGLWVLAFGPLFLLLGNPPFDPQTAAALDRFLAAAGLGLCVLAAAALEALWRRGRAGRLCGAALVAALLAWPALRGEGLALRNDLAAYDYGRSLLRTLPPGSFLFIDGGDDTFYSMAYLRDARGLRPDLDVRDRGALIFPNAYGADFKILNAQDKEARRERIEGWLARSGALYYSTLSDSLLPGFALRPWGLLRRAEPPGTGREDAFAAWEFYPRRWEPALLSDHYRDRAVAALYPVMRADADADAGAPDRALEELRLAVQTGGDALWVAPQAGYRAAKVGERAFEQGRFSLSGRAFALQAAIEPRNAAAPCNAGAAAERQGRMDQALKWYQWALRVDPGFGRAQDALRRLSWKARSQASRPRSL